jgi:hypothetical protein
MLLPKSFKVTSKKLEMRIVNLRNEMNHLMVSDLQYAKQTREVKEMFRRAEEYLHMFLKNIDFNPEMIIAQKIDAYKKFKKG